MKKYLLEIDGKKYEVEVDLSGSEPNVFVNGKKIDVKVNKVLQWPILYYHLPLAINSFLACFFIMICSVLYLKTNN